ncbi:hypothetical protein PMAYCL1PPCAC_20189, partial [Pristionchus mayeri]
AHIILVMFGWPKTFCIFEQFSHRYEKEPKCERGEQNRDKFEALDDPSNPKDWRFVDFVLPQDYCNPHSSRPISEREID